MTELKTKEQFIELRAENVSYAKISKQLGVSKPTLIKWAKELETDIANMRTVNMTALYEQYKISKQHKLEMWAEQLHAVRDELKSRGYKDVATERLVDLLERFGSLLEKEQEPLWLKSEPVKSYEIPMPTFDLQDKWKP
jgi:hypothetical protein